MVSTFFFLIIGVFSGGAMAGSSPLSPVNIKPSFEIEISSEELEVLAAEFKDLKAIEELNVRPSGTFTRQDEAALEQFRAVASERWIQRIARTIGLRASFFKIRSQLHRKSSNKIRKIIRRGFARSSQKNFQLLIAGFADLSNLADAVNLCETLSCTQVIHDALSEWIDFSRRSNKKIPRKRPSRYQFSYQFKSPLNIQVVQELYQNLFERNHEEAAIRNLALGILHPYLLATRGEINLGQDFVRSVGLSQVKVLPFHLRPHNRRVFSVLRRALKKIYRDQNVAIVTGEGHLKRKRDYRYSYLLDCATDSSLNAHVAVYGWTLETDRCKVPSGRDYQLAKNLSIDRWIVGPGLKGGLNQVNILWVVSPIPLDLSSYPTTWVGSATEVSFAIGGGLGLYIGPRGAVASSFRADILGAGVSTGISWFKLTPQD